MQRLRCESQSRLARLALLLVHTLSPAVPPFHDADLIPRLEPNPLDNEVAHGVLLCRLAQHQDALKDRVVDERTATFLGVRLVLGEGLSKGGELHDERHARQTDCRPQRELYGRHQHCRSEVGRNEPNARRLDAVV